jgi:hypothetical protein
MSSPLVCALLFPVASQISQSAVTKASGIAKPRIFTFFTTGLKVMKDNKEQRK